MATAQPKVHRVAAHRALWLPGSFAAGILLLSLLPRIAGNAILAWSFRAAAACLLAWLLVLLIGSRRAAQARTLELRPRRQHYIQALVQTSVYLYWGYFWPPVYEHAWLLLGQLLFIYAADMLLSWSRRTTYVLGFGAFPIVLSTNLFLWFKDDWFYLQFVMLAVGLLGKELVRWQRDGKETHIFNPSAFTLGLFSLMLIATGTTDLTWGPQIASTLTLAPHIYAYLFVAGLVVMYFFAITPIAATAAAMLFGLSSGYAALTGVPYFLDSEIPAAVFLGLHLLVTDPSTSPRTPLGKALFGALYGLGVFALYWLLGLLGAPTFYDKLLCVPLLNLSVQGIDRLAQSLSNSWSGPAASSRFATANLTHMGLWAVLFIAMALRGKTDGRHDGDRVPFWQQACEENRRHACERLIQLEITYCSDNSAWACNELGAHHAAGRIVALDTERALQLYAKSCELRFPAACSNLAKQPRQATRAPPHELDLRLLLREGGLNLTDATSAELYQRACEHGWQFACNDVAALN